MPGLLFTFLSIPTYLGVTKLVWHAGKIGLFIWGAVAIQQQKSSRWMLELDLNPVRDEWRERQGMPVAIGHYRLSESDLKHPSQVWALGDFFWFDFEWLQVAQYMEVDAANVVQPGSCWTGVDGERLFYVGRLRFQDERLRAIIFGTSKVERSPA